MNVVHLSAAIAEKQAREWLAILSKTVISNDDLRRFFEWRSTPANREAYARVDARPGERSRGT